mmetsp:Transcript_53037/g.128695  ORF Transcript_53037/g.128695 Transcript_53037/m.128695 type:complete len:446 (-) Transcript_53037:112-1449(-)
MNTLKQEQGNDEEHQQQQPQQQQQQEKQHNDNHFTHRKSHRILEGGWRYRSSRSSIRPRTSSSSPHRDGGDAKTTSAAATTAAALSSQTYVNYPLVQNMMMSESVRTAALEFDGQKQIFYTKSNEGWFRTLFVLEGRALGLIVWPWVFITANAILWTCISELVLQKPLDPEDFIPFEGLLSLVATTTLSFLLVFRLNRSAERYWVARNAWGDLLYFSRTLVSGVLIHGSHDPDTRDDVIRWVAAFAMSTCTFMHGIRDIPSTFMAGIIDDKTEVRNLESAPHPPIYAMGQVRWNLSKLFAVDGHTPISIAQDWSKQLVLLESQLNRSMGCTGAMERIKSTPLPLVYVAHLRTWLFLMLLIMPYIWAASLGWLTIPTVCLAGFAYLGLDGSALEMEAPFRKDRVNHLNMDAYVLLLMTNIFQLAKQEADRDMDLQKKKKKREGEEC